MKKVIFGMLFWGLGNVWAADDVRVLKERTLDKNLKLKQIVDGKDPLLLEGETEIGNHGDPYQKKWRSAKRIAVALLRRMTKDDLLPSVAKPVVDFLSAGNDKGKTQFELLADDLEQSKLTFTPMGKSNTEGTCAQTGNKPLSPISISEVDCGEVELEMKLQTLIGDATHHFGNDDDDFTDAVGEAVVVSYLEYFEARPKLALFERYRGTHNGKDLIVKFTPSRTQVERVQGDLDVRLAKMPHLHPISGGFGSEGNHGSFGCERKGLGRDPKTGEIGIGVVDSWTVYLSASVRIEVEPFSETITMSLSYEVPSRGPECTKDRKSTSLKLFPYPPTPEEIEAKRLESNWTRLLKVAGSNQWNQVLEILEEGIPVANYKLLLEEIALKPNQVEIAEKIAAKMKPQQTITIWRLLKYRDGEFIRAVGQSQILRPFINLGTKQNHYTPVGEVLKSRRSFETYAAWEKFALNSLEGLFAMGANPLEPVSDFANRSHPPLISAVSEPFPSQPVVKLILAYMPEGTVDTLNRDGRSAFDYLTFNYNLTLDGCRAHVEANPSLKNSYASAKANYQAVLKLLRDAKTNYTRNGCIYYRRVSCGTDPVEKGINLSIETDFNVKQSTLDCPNCVPEFCG